MKVILQRIETGDQGTFGRIDLNGMTFFSGELPWRENAPNISCIPSGLYRCSWTYSPRFARSLYLVGPVEQRTGVRLHSANYMGSLDKGYRAQLNGCIALGEKLGYMDGQKALLLSSPAIRRFEALLQHKEFTLEVRPCLKL